MITLGLLMHWFASLLLTSMATFALVEARSSSLIPKSLFFWPAAGMGFGILTLLSSVSGGVHSQNSLLYLITGLLLIICSVQAFLVNIRKLSRWPSGTVWLGLILVALIAQFPTVNSAEPLFQLFFIRLSGLLWAVIGIVKVISERSVSQEGGVPPWILLLYVQALLLAASPS